MKYRLGLDIGTNSIGWAVLDLENSKPELKIHATGVRIFSDGRDSKSKSTLKATRREARSMRRQRDRYIQRRTYLLDELTKNGLFPSDETERHELQKLNPLEIRAKALTQKIPLFHIGRAVFHLNQRRGFKSNRKDKSAESTEGVVSQASVKLLQLMNLIEVEQSSEECSENKDNRAQGALKRQDAIAKLSEMSELSYGSFLWERQNQGLSTRARPNSDTKLYDVYPTRELLEDEFHKIWNGQAKHYPSILTTEMRDRLYQVIFFQRKLKSQPKGKCVYFPDQDRVYRAMPSFQRYRIYQEVNNLAWKIGVEDKRLIDCRQNRDAVIELLEHTSIKSKPTLKNALVTFKKIRTELKRREASIDDSSMFNLESERRKGLFGNTTTKIFQHEDYIGPKWHSWSLEKQDEFVSIILDDKFDDIDVCDILVKKFRLSEYAAEMCVNAQLEAGTANISGKAIRVLTELMENEMLIQSEAVKQAPDRIPEFRSPYKTLGDGKVLDQLPYYGLVVEGHIIPGNPDADDEQTRTGMVTNPTVHIALNQLRLVVNELIRRFGHPDSIAIELARDLPAGKLLRQEIEGEQRKNQNTNERYDHQLLELGRSLTRKNRLKIRLWEDQGHRCVFTGRTIGCAELFSDAVEIEHLIPFSISIDDSYSNKVVCLREANRDKGKKIPFEAFSHNPKNYVWYEICSRVKDLPKSKQWRFDEDALEKWNKNSQGDFTSRHLNDTRYIGRLAKEYLETICPFNKIDVVTGRLTALLRGHWGLNRIMSEIQENGSQHTAKNRNDHRHHAIDAIVVGMTSRSTIQRLATEAKLAEELEEQRLFLKGKLGSAIEPWDQFRDHVKLIVGKIIVSHKAKRKDLGHRFASRNKERARSSITDGQLHNDTAYGIVSNCDGEANNMVVVRWPVTRFTTKAHLEKIRDGHLKKLFIDAFERDPKNGIMALASAIGVRSLRRVESMNVIQILDKKSNSYKAFKGDSNWGMEIFEYASGHPKAEKWEGVVISRYCANQKNFQPGTTCRPHPAAKLVMRLQINDCIQISDGRKPSVMRLQKMSQSGQLEFAPHNEANVDARNRDPEDGFAYWRKSPNVLKSLKAKKVFVSPTGCICVMKR